MKRILPKLLVPTSVTTVPLESAGKISLRHPRDTPSSTQVSLLPHQILAHIVRINSLSTICFTNTNSTHFHTLSKLDKQHIKLIVKLKRSYILQVCTLGWKGEREIKNKNCVRRYIPGWRHFDESAGKNPRTRSNHRRQQCGHNQVLPIDINTYNTRKLPVVTPSDELHNPAIKAQISENATPASRTQRSREDQHQKPKVTYQSQQGTLPTDDSNCYTKNLLAVPPPDEASVQTQNPWELSTSHDIRIATTSTRQHHSRLEQEIHDGELPPAFNSRQLRVLQLHQAPQNSCASTSNLLQLNPP